MDSAQGIQKFPSEPQDLTYMVVCDDILLCGRIDFPGIPDHGTAKFKGIAILGTEASGTTHPGKDLHTSKKLSRLTLTGPEGGKLLFLTAAL